MVLKSVVLLNVFTVFSIRLSFYPIVPRRVFPSTDKLPDNSKLSTFIPPWNIALLVNVVVSLKVAILSKTDISNAVNGSWTVTEP